MKQGKWLILLLGIPLLLASCYRIDVINDSQELYLSSSMYEQWNHVYFFGLINHDRYLSAHERCTGRHQWLRIRSERSIDNYLASMVTFHFLWTPTMVYVQCGKPGPKQKRRRNPKPPERRAP